jgi:hypothetical protein
MVAFVCLIPKIPQIDNILTPYLVSEGFFVAQCLWSLALIASILKYKINITTILLSIVNCFAIAFNYYAAMGQNASNIWLAQYCYDNYDDILDAINITEALILFIGALLIALFSRLSNIGPFKRMGYLHAYNSTASDSNESDMESHSGKNKCR